MAHPHVIEAVTARLKTGFSGAEIREPNTSTAAGASRQPFVALQFPMVMSDIFTVDGETFLEEGTFRFVIVLRKAEGIANGLTWAEEIAALFRLAEFDDIQCFAPTSPTTDDRNETDAFYRLSFSVPYEFHFEPNGE